MYYRGYEMRFGLDGETVSVGVGFTVLHTLRKPADDTLINAGRAYIDFLYDSEENDRTLEAQKDNYEDKTERTVKHV